MQQAEEEKPALAPPTEAVPAEESDPLHIGNLVAIVSEAHGLTVGRIVYRDLTAVRIMPQEASDRAIEFRLTEDGSGFVPELGVSSIEIIEEQTSDYYVDFLGARPGEVLEFFYNGWPRGCSFWNCRRNHKDTHERRYSSRRWSYN